VNSRPCKIAVSGTHSTGKSTFIASIRDVLESRGVRVESVHYNAVDAQRIGFPILAEHTFGSTAWLMARAIELEEEAALKADVVLIDRPVSDALGYLLAALRHTGRALKAGQYERLVAICDAWAGEYDAMFLTLLDPTIPLGSGRDHDAVFRSAAADAITEVVDRVFPDRYVLDKAGLDGALAHAIAAVEGRQ
jgi:hypothetical protein